MMKKTMIFVLCAVILVLSGCSTFERTKEDMDQVQAQPYIALAEQYEAALWAGDFATAYAMCSDALCEQLSREEMEQAWENVRISYGDATQVESRAAYYLNGEPSIVSQILHKHGGSSMQLTFGKVGEQLEGLWFGLYEGETTYNLTPPDGVVEERIRIGVDTEYPLEGILTLPQGVQIVPAVVLVHGSGPSDRNASIGNAAPFADIAWGLAQNGIASIRYDKRTLVYGENYTKQQVQMLTVQEETIQDVNRAVDLLVKDARIDAEAIVIVGHSLGGMLAPRIAVGNEKIGGIVSLAGTPRGFVDVVYDQNMTIATDDNRKSAIKKEYKRLEKLDNMRDSDVLFGIPAPYLKDLYAHPVQASLEKLSIPILVLQGDSDFQITTTDYKAWQQVLSGYAGDSELILFENLNHLFVNNLRVKNKGTVQEYLDHGNVAPEVIQSIVKWISEKFI